MTVAPDRLTLVPVDPTRALATWRLAPASMLRALRTLRGDAADARLAIELRDAVGTTMVAEPPAGATEILLPVRPDTPYVARLGLLLRSGRFASLVASAGIRTPPDAPGESGSPRWVTTTAPHVPAPPPPVVGSAPAERDAPPGSRGRHA